MSSKIVTKLALSFLVVEGRREKCRFYIACEGKKVYQFLKEKTEPPCHFTLFKRGKKKHQFLREKTEFSSH